MAIDIKDLVSFGTITGQVTNDELLGNIFANFCIGK
jgi:tRNA modification GTPase